MLANLDKNALFIGRNNCYLVNCLPTHKNYAVGTSRTLPTKSSGFGNYTFELIRSHVLRYASRGSQIDVFLLDVIDEPLKPVSLLLKSKESVYTPPGCTLYPRNGIKLPRHVMIPVSKEHLRPELIGNWDEMRAEIVALLKNMRNVQCSTTHEETGNELTVTNNMNSDY